ncbi:MAG: heavy metal-associated domain-containing protein [Pseudohongiellaceae bacterium]
MKRTTLIEATVAALALGGVTAALLPAVSADNETRPQVATTAETANFTVENMTCALCPITVRKAMEQVEGVQSVVIDLEANSATVVFDPAIADPAQIAAASTNAGFPATPAS